MVEATNTLYYYGMTGRAQQVRFTLAAGGIAFTDQHPAGFPPTPEEKAAWVAIGGNTTTNVPMLTAGGKTYTQSSAVLRAAARMGGLMPADDFEAYQVDNLISACDDLRSQGYSSMPMFGASAEAIKKYTDTTMPTHVGNLQRLLGDNDWYVGNKFSVADITVYDVLTSQVTTFLPGSLDAFPKLSAFVKRVEETEKIAAYR